VFCCGSLCGRRVGRLYFLPNVCGRFLMTLARLIYEGEKFALIPAAACRGAVLFFENIRGGMNDESL
jgi:hypothetical protein